MTRLKATGILALSLVFSLFCFSQTVDAIGDVDPDSYETICISLSANLRYRSTDRTTNNQVSMLQDFLSDKGYLKQEPTGYFGKVTLSAVKKFQALNGLDATGYVGPLTREMVQAISCGSNPIPITEVKKPAILNPVVSTEHILGNVNAPIKIVEFGNTGSPFSKAHYSTLKLIVANNGNKVAWVYRHFPMTQLFPKDQREAEALECAGMIGGNDTFWKYLDRIMAVTQSNNSLTDSSLLDIASYANLNRTAFLSCLDGGSATARVNVNLAEATSLGLTGVPQAFVVSPTGRKYDVQGAQPIDTIQEIINKALTESGNTVSVAPTASVTITSPSSLIYSKRNTELSWAWTSRGNVPSVDIYLQNSASQSFALTKNYPNTGTFWWATGYPVTDSNQDVPNGTYTIAVCPPGGDFIGCGKFVVIIYGDTPSIGVTYPNGGESYQPGSTIDVAFTNPREGETYEVNLVFSSKGPMTYKLGTVYGISADQMKNSFLIPSNVPLGTYSVEVLQLTNKGKCLNVCARAESNQFTVTTGPFVRILSPNGGETLSTNQSFKIKYYIPKDNRYAVDYYLVPQGPTPLRSGDGTYFDPAAGGYAIGGFTPNYLTSYIDTDVIIPNDIPFGIYKLRTYLRNPGSGSNSFLSYDDSDSAFMVGR